jgi:hypothetical protein
MNNKGIQKPHSRLGIASVGIAVINIGIFAYFFYRMTTYIINHSELMRNLMLINGMEIGQTTYILFVGFFILQVIGLLLGLSGLFNSRVKKLFPVLGTVVNGLFVLFTAIKIGIL